MKMDNIDLDMFLFFLENGERTHTVIDITKEIFNPKDRSEMINKASLLNYRLNKWCKKGYFICEKIDKIKHYTIKLKAVYYEENCQLTIKTGKALIFEMDDETFIVHFLKE